MECCFLPEAPEEDLDTGSKMNDLLQWTNNNLALTVSALNAIFVSALFIHFYFRAGSLLFLRDKLWHYLGGKESFYTNELEQMRKDARELEHFRFEFNVPANCIKDAKQFENWVSENQIPLISIKRAREYIDWSDFSKLNTININYKIRTRLTLAWAITLYTAFAIFVAFILSPYLFLHFNEPNNSNTFFMSTKEARFGYFFGSPILNKESCRENNIKDDIKKSYNMTIKQIETICLAFTNEGDQKHLHNEIKKQRIAMSIFAVLLLYFFFTAIKRSIKLSAAKNINEQLRSSS